METKTVVAIASTTFVVGFIYGHNACQYGVKKRLTKVQPLINNAVDNLMRKTVAGEMTPDEMSALALQEVDFVKIALKLS